MEGPTKEQFAEWEYYARYGSPGGGRPNSLESLFYKIYRAGWNDGFDGED